MQAPEVIFVSLLVMHKWNVFNKNSSEKQKRPRGTAACLRAVLYNRILYCVYTVYSVIYRK